MLKLLWIRKKNMCSISSNTVANKQLKDLELSHDKVMIEKRLFCFANEANTDTPGALDRPQTHMKRMPIDLKDVRKITIGRHRIYFTGHHSRCSYDVIYIKKFKKTGVDDDDDRNFQKKLKLALQYSVNNIILSQNNK